MQATIDMQVRPNSAAKFRAYIAFQDYINDNWSSDPCVSVNIVINEIYYVKPCKKRPAMWQFIGTIETRTLQRVNDESDGFAWVRGYDSVFVHLVTATDVATAMQRHFKA
jgi:hypothetical protein